jgi:hypothetical protein
MYGPDKGAITGAVVVLLLIGVFVGIVLSTFVPWVASHLRVSWT